MNYQLVKQVRENNPLRKSFIDLAVKTFDLSFEEWYQQGYWTDAYIPYAFVERNKVIAKEGANKQVISSQADSLIKISRIWADFFPANTSNQPI